ncbi:MAG: hypothetical protein E7774_08835 [Bradyrhizobium sp.]|nr:MAG: hypothetical protein E7774_08835 [Bradyrhizobium sp.]
MSFMLHEMRVFVMTVFMSSDAKRDAFSSLKRALSLDFIKPEIRQIVRSLVAEKYVQFVQIRFQDSVASGGGAGEKMVLLEPSDLLLRLCAALAANDSDKVLAINHQLRSP